MLTVALSALLAKAQSLEAGKPEYSFRGTLAPGCDPAAPQVTQLGQPAKPKTLSGEIVIFFPVSIFIFPIYFHYESSYGIY